MGNIPLKIGENINSSSGINFFNLNSSNSSSGSVAKTGVELGTSFLSLLLAGVVTRNSADKSGSAGSTGGTSAADPLQTAKQEAQQALQNININLANINGQIAALNEGCTSQDQIDAKEKSIKDLETEVNSEVKTADGETITKDKVSKYIEADKNYQTAKANYDTANTNVTNAQTRVDTLEAELNSIDESCGSEEDVKTAKETKQKELAKAQEDLNNAKAEAEKAKTVLEQAQKDLTDVNVSVNKKDNSIDKLDWQKIIDAKLDKIKEEKSELAEMKATMKSNQEKLDKLYQQRSDLETQRAGAEAVYNKMITDNVVAQGNKNRQINATGSEYTEADQKDGSWWKRTMPSWLGGASKAERTLMKQAHQEKDAAGDKLAALGVDAGQYSEKSVAKAERLENAENKTNELIKGFTNSDAKNNLNKNSTKIKAYFIENPDKTIEEAKKELGIQENGTMN